MIVQRVMGISHGGYRFGSQDLCTCGQPATQERGTEREEGARARERPAGGRGRDEWAQEMRGREGPPGERGMEVRKRERDQRERETEAQERGTTGRERGTGGRGT